MKKQTISALCVEVRKQFGQEAVITVEHVTGRKDVVKEFRKEKVYLAGPQTNAPREYWLKAIETARRLREKGYDVWSPHESEIQNGFVPGQSIPKPFREYMAVDLPILLRSDIMAVLPDWRDSRGTNLEMFVAMECHMPVVTAEGLLEEE